MQTNLPLCFITAPVDTLSGYGKISISMVRSILALGKFDVKIASLDWGMTERGILKTGIDDDILNCILQPGQQLQRQPELHVHCGIPSEHAKIGKFNILYSALNETDRLSQNLLEESEKSDLIITISEHTKKIAANTIIDIKNNQQLVKRLQITKPIEVIHGPIDTSLFRKLEYKEIDIDIQNLFVDIKEKFCFIFCGHWLAGEFGKDRKNVGELIKIFCETFKNTSSANMPALILKTSGGACSLLDKEEMIKRIKQIKSSCQGVLPNIYLLHGKLTDSQMSSLYNHPKVKCMISIAHGESEGLPLAEFSMIGKPIICSAWGGFTDFLNPKDAIFVGGKLEPVHPSATMENIITTDMNYFYPDPNMVANSMMHVFKNYDNFIEGAKKLAKQNREQFSISAVQQKTKEVFEKYVPDFRVPQQIIFNLPKLKTLPSIQNNENIKIHI